MKAQEKNRFVIIMAGGRGERFWPVSREKTPKQLIKLLGNRSFLQEAVDRVLPLVPLKNILIITNAAQAPEVRRQLPKLPHGNIVSEPIGRDTCAAVTLGAALVGARSTTAVMAVLPADHVIPEPRKFQQVLADSFDLAGRGQAIVTIGIKPTEPATGYGYIRVGNPLPPPAGVKRYKTTFHRAEQFVEKPQFDTALEYVNSGRYRWNAGMFIWSFVTITEALQKHQTEMHEACQRWFKAAAQPAKLARVLAREYPAIKRISVDYAIFEKSSLVSIIPVHYPWSDLGSWEAVYALAAKEATRTIPVVFSISKMGFCFSGATSAGPDSFAQANLSSAPSLRAMTSGPAWSSSGMPAATRISGPRFG